MNIRGVLWNCLYICGLLVAVAHSKEARNEQSLGDRVLTLNEDSSHKSVERQLDDSGPSLSNSGIGNPVRNSCSEIDLSIVEPGRVCGSPLGQPCFDFSRCRPVSQGGLGPTIYVYDHDCTLKDSSELEFAREVDDGHFLSPIWRDAARDVGVLAEKYETACAFIEVNMRRAKDPPCATRSPLWNNGVNHLIMDFTDTSRETRPTVASSLAMEGASNIRTCLYRSGYDMSVPLSPEHLFPQFSDIPIGDRKYFLTVKGSVYLGGTGSEERMSIVPLHDPSNGVVSSMHCFEVHGEHLLPENVDYCEALKARYNEYDYTDLMNSTFGLVPGGRSQGTYRLAEVDRGSNRDNVSGTRSPTEISHIAASNCSPFNFLYSSKAMKNKRGRVMSAGALPVFIGRDIVRPFREQIHWSSFSFIFTPDEVGSLMVETLKAVSPEMLEQMQHSSRQAYLEIYGDNPGKGQTRAYAHISRNVIRELVQRIERH